MRFVPATASFETTVGVGGFEPPTTSTPNWCATRLRYTPKMLAVTGTIAPRDVSESASRKVSMYAPAASFASVM